MKYIVVFSLIIIGSCSPKEQNSIEEWEAQKSILDSLIQNTEYQKAIELALSRIEFAESQFINDHQLSNSYSDLGLIYQQMGYHDLSKKYFDKSLSIYPNNGVANYNYGLLFRDMNELVEAVRQFEKAIDIYQKDDQQINDQASITRAELGLATTLVRMGKTEDSKNITDKVINSAKAIGDSTLLYGAQKNLSTIYLMNRKFKPAIENYKYIQNNLLPPSVQEHGNLLNDIGSVYYFQQNYDSAIFFFQAAIDLKLKHYSDSIVIVTNLKNLASAYKLDSQYSKSNEIELALKRLKNR